MFAVVTDTNLYFRGYSYGFYLNEGGAECPKNTHWTKNSKQARWYESRNTAARRARILQRDNPWLKVGVLQ